jgi:carboxylate-amine ligase
MQLEWKYSKPLTLGVEWELQILDRETLQPKEIFSELVEELPAEFLPMVHKEIYQSMLELVTPPMEDEKQIIRLLRDILDSFKTFAVKKKFRLTALGTLFLKNENPPRINISKRYKLFAEEFQEILRDFYIYGIHVHIGIPNADWAIRAYNNFVKYAALLLAFSANSVFYRGKNTGIHSYRMVIFEKLPRAVLPRPLKDFKEFNSLIENLRQTGVIETLKDLWWHIRPRPDFGTIEIRVFDSFWNLEKLEFLLKLIKTIALYSETYEEKLLPWEILNQNWWWAKRYSLDADFIDEKGRRALKGVAYDLFYKFEDLGILKKLGYKVSEFTKFLRKPSLAKDILLKEKAVGLHKVIELNSPV